MNKEVKSELIFDSRVDSPEVTIAIPTYKRDKMLIEAVMSAVNQDFDKPFEVIVVDNNPERNDITETAMNTLKHHINLAYYKNGENIGMMGNWNRLYVLAKGKYVVMLHDDDILFPDYLYIVFSFLKKVNYRFQMVYPSFSFSKTREFFNRERPRVVSYREMLVQDFVVTQWGIPSGMMITKDAYIEAGGYMETLFPVADQEFIYRALHYVRCVEIRVPLLLYYIGANVSMRPDIIKEIISQEKEMNYIMRRDKDNIWRLFAYLCYRYQIWNIVCWCKTLSDTDVFKISKETIGLTPNFPKDKMSRLCANFLKLYIYIMRVRKISLK